MTELDVIAFPLQFGVIQRTSQGNNGAMGNVAPIPILSEKSEVVLPILIDFFLR